MTDYSGQLQQKLSPEHFNRITALGNEKLNAFVAEAIELCKPDSVYVCTDSQADMDYLRKQAVVLGEEKSLNTQGHTYHFDGYTDQGRDPGATKFLLPKGTDLGKRLASIDKQTGLDEIRGYLKDAMKGRQMLICFWCLGPTNSDFSIPCAQITDSAYVAHSESILYRGGYAQFKKLAGKPGFFRFLHSAGELENFVSKNTDKRKIYIDLEEEMVYTSNTQYAGNTVGLKKLALRLAVQKASREGWLAEHMFVMGVNGPNNRKTYFVGAFPSACGKTSTAMITGQTIVGDDIAYFRKRNGKTYAANVEQGIFGIIQDVNPKDDPVIYNALVAPGEVIYSNVLIKDGKPYWLGMGSDIPTEGVNYAGKWHKGMKDSEGNEITASHKNARYTVRISELKNRDPEIDNPEGVEFGAVLYGGRDSDTCVPVEQAFDWKEGIILKGASIESETTAASIGEQGVRKFDIMSNMMFVSVPLGKYIQNNLDFANGVKNPPKVFSVNYFLKDEDGQYLNSRLDKLIWVLWSELRANGDVEAIKSPTGWIPKYEDLKKLFKENLNFDFTQEAYVKQFTIRVPELLAKYERVEKIYRDTVADTPKVVFDTFAEVKDRLKKAQAKHGDYISPLALA